MASVTKEQYDFLLKPIAPSRVQELRGNSHVEAWDIRRYLIRIFGFGGYDVETIECSCVSEIITESSGKPRYTVTYRVQARLIVKNESGERIAHYEDGACGGSVNQPSHADAHDNAMKTALSQALKRCAMNWGDQFGLGLYNDGSTDAAVVRSLVVPGVETKAEDLSQAAKDDAPVVPEASSSEPAEQTQTESIAPPVGQPASEAPTVSPGSADVILTKANIIRFSPFRDAAKAYGEMATASKVRATPAGQVAVPPLTIYDLWINRLSFEMSESKTIEEIERVEKMAEWSKVIGSSTPVGMTIGELILLRKNTIVNGGDNKPMAAAAVAAALGGHPIVEKPEGWTPEETQGD